MREEDKRHNPAYRMRKLDNCTQGQQIATAAAHPEGRFLSLVVSNPGRIWTRALAHHRMWVTKGTCNM